ncbi:hypothetical protein SAY87_006767 [Trapa incisa]|uniref:Uncharacterized protein n=1 Tax=Trapa incisa TaxID=236973 RepID=A0AAN7K2Z1_9MYRT|nr:hypothetical protein SAY87_006767 [Trapa incisa]
MKRDTNLYIAIYAPSNSPILVGCQFNVSKSQVDTSDEGIGDDVSLLPTKTWEHRRPSDEGANGGLLPTHISELRISANGGSDDDGLPPANMSELRRSNSKTSSSKSNFMTGSSPAFPPTSSP